MTNNVIKGVLVGLLLAVSTSTAFAAGPYVGVAGGVSIVHDSDVKIPGYTTGTTKYDTGVGVNVSVGGSSEGAGRFEGEFGYKTAGIKNSSYDAAVMSFMANGYYDIKSESAVTPYFGAGIGVLNGELKVGGYKADDTVFGYQFMVGTGISVSKAVTLDLSYRFQGAATDLNIAGAKVSYMSSNIYGGIRLNF